MITAGVAPLHPTGPRAVTRLAALTVTCALGGGLLLGCAPSSGEQAPTSAPSPVATAPAQITNTKTVDRRTVDLTVKSPALGSQVKVRLLLPHTFGQDRARRWPVLFLLHGCCDTYLSWTRSTDIEQLTAASDLLVVMPDGGTAGFYTNWRHGPHWETFHLTELPDLLRQHYRANDTWAIGGNSMGGLGALGYTARHPGMFQAAASFSGIVHTRLTTATAQNYRGLVASQGKDPADLWGDPTRDTTTWAAHNPYDLAPHLVGTPLFLSVGNGQPGPLDNSDSGADEIETALARENRAFRSRLTELKAEVTVDFYGPGRHDWPYWQRELHAAWPMFEQALDLR